MLTLSALSPDPCGVRVRHGRVPRVVQGGLEEQHLWAGGHRVQGLAGVDCQKTNLGTVHQPELKAYTCLCFKINYLVQLIMNPSGTRWPGRTASLGRRALSTRTGWSALSENQSRHSAPTGAKSLHLLMVQNKLPSSMNIDLTSYTLQFSEHSLDAPYSISQTSTPCKKESTVAGLEPAIPRSEVWCLIH